MESREVSEAGEVLARSLADWRAYWNAQGTLTKAQKRWREHEREWRTNLAAEGLLLADSLAADIRSGAKARRDEQNMRDLLRDQARLARLRRKVYSFDLEHRLVAPGLARIHIPVATPRERRVSRRRSVSRVSSSAPDEPHPLAVIPPSVFGAELRRALGVVVAP